MNYPLFLSDFDKTWIFSTEIRKKALISSLINIHPVGAELFQAERQTDMTQLITPFRNILNVPKTKKNRCSALN